MLFVFGALDFRHAGLSEGMEGRVRLRCLWNIEGVCPLQGWHMEAVDADEGSCDEGTAPAWKECW